MRSLQKCESEVDNLDERRGPSVRPTRRPVHPSTHPSVHLSNHPSTEIHPSVVGTRLNPLPYTSCRTEPSRPLVAGIVVCLHIFVMLFCCFLSFPWIRTSPPFAPRPGPSFAKEGAFFNSRPAPTPSVHAREFAVDLFLENPGTGRRRRRRHSRECNNNLYSFVHFQSFFYTHCFFAILLAPVLIVRRVVEAGPVFVVVVVVVSAMFVSCT